MNHLFRTVAPAAVIAAVASINMATAQTAFTGTNIADDRNEDLLEAIQDDAERETDAFGNEGRPQGFAGSVALRGIASSGNTDSTDVGIGASLGYVQGANGYDLQLSYSYGDQDGTKNEESLFYGLEYTRDFTPAVFGFAKIQGSVDEFSSFESDTFVSLGAGYRVFNEADRQWSIQAGPGYRFAKLSDIAAADIDEAAIGLSSDYFHRISDTVTFTNDTDIVFSDSDNLAINDLAINVAMSDTLALRTSVVTEYHTDPLPGFTSTDNTFGVSLVYSFK
jgi:putative salt-induced outer membrane protein